MATMATMAIATIAMATMATPAPAPANAPARATAKRSEFTELSGLDRSVHPPDTRRRMSQVRKEEAFGWPEMPRRVESATEAKSREGARRLIALWTHATRVRQRADATLRAYDLSFPLWWVLYVTDELIRETSDAVSQRAVANRTNLDKSSVSYLMGVLAERSLVDRGPEFGGNSYRIWLTQKGQTLLLQASLAIETAVSKEGLQGP